MKTLDVFQMENVQGGQNFGEDVMDCMLDVYSNHGLISLWAFVQTAFIPQTAVALAIACVVENV